MTKKDNSGRQNGSFKQFDGKTYKEISQIMTDMGYNRMKHSNVRTTFVLSLAKIAGEISMFYGENKTKKELIAIAINPMFQESVRDYMYDIQKLEKTDGYPIDD